jgi:hypothetical protein
MRIIGVFACFLASIDHLLRALSIPHNATLPSWVLWIGVIGWFGWFLAFILKKDLNNL